MALRMNHRHHSTLHRLRSTTITLMRLVHRQRLVSAHRLRNPRHQLLSFRSSAAEPGDKRRTIGKVSSAIMEWSLGNKCWIRSICSCVHSMTDDNNLEKHHAKLVPTRPRLVNTATGGYSAAATDFLLFFEPRRFFLTTVVSSMFRLTGRPFSRTAFPTRSRRK